MRSLLYILLFFSLIIGGIIIQTTVGDLDTSSWSFAGSNMASLFINYIGAILMLVGSVGVIRMIWEDKS